ncbi:hypothetical protein FJY68_07625 [candidate division WOR-3 bacterium]|uniref:Uncharacterized protein n=1 Tax=candidate division WOR-3 bacterium TaxID=2052148 RepID=A0A937XEQ4_UNCW3|nr:hypothetical protein [candidate division WOR-3 bacterium]
MQVAGLDELKKAVKALEPEIVVTDESLARKILFWNTLRTIANILVIVVLAVGIAWWANPLRIPELEQEWALLARRIILGFGVLMLFAEYVIPIVRLYKPAGKDALGLKLVPRKSN